MCVCVCVCVFVRNESRDHGDTITRVERSELGMQGRRNTLDGGSVRRGVSKGWNVSLKGSLPLFKSKVTVGRTPNFPFLLFFIF